MDRLFHQYLERVTSKQDASSQLKELQSINNQYSQELGTKPHIEPKDFKDMLAHMNGYFEFFLEMLDVATQPAWDFYPEEVDLERAQFSRLLRQLDSKFKHVVQPRQPTAEELASGIMTEEQRSRASNHGIKAWSQIGHDSRDQITSSEHSLSKRQFRHATVEDSDDADEPLSNEQYEKAASGVSSNTKTAEYSHQNDSNSNCLNGNHQYTEVKVEVPTSSSSVLKRARDDDDLDYDDYQSHLTPKRHRTSPFNIGSPTKRKQNDHDAPEPSAKRWKDSHTSSHFSEEATFVPEVEYADLSEEVDARLKLKQEKRAKVKAELQDTSRKRKKKIATDPVTVDFDQHEPRKRVRHEEPSVEHEAEEL